MKNFIMQDLLIDHTSSIKDAMKKLDIVASKILFVVEDDNFLIGSLTDGDIRRYILSNGSLDKSVIEACNKKTFRVAKPINEKSLAIEMEKKDIIFTPVVNDKGIIEDILSYTDVTKHKLERSLKKLDMPVVIMAGGKGTRMEPFTNVLPKPLIPVGDKTMLEYIIDEYRNYQIDNFYITINYKGNLIKAYFDGTEKNYRINYLEEKEFCGTAGSLRILKEVPETFIVSNCDIIVKANYNDVIEFHRSSNSVLTILSSIQHHAIPYGVVEFKDGGQVTNIQEKPEFSLPINTGVYILSKEAWDYIPENMFFHMTHLIEVLIKNGKKVMTYPVSESEYIDIGQWDEYKSALLRLNP